MTSRTAHVRMPTPSTMKVARRCLRVMSHRPGLRQVGRGQRALANAISFLRFPLVPDAPVLEGIGDVRRHVALVVLDEHRVGEQAAGGVELAFHYCALALAKEVRED